MELSPAATVPAPQNRRDQIPDELITDILLRLPLDRCTVRFRCVSKSWCDLLSDPCFIRKNRRSSPASDHHQFMVEYGVGDDKSRRVLHSLHSSETLEPLLPSPLQLPINPDTIRIPGSDPSLSVAGCCNGLFCLTEYHSRQEPDLIIWNPATSESKVVPTSPFEHRPDVSVGAVGFGFDSVTNDYKIIRPLFLQVMCCFRSRYFLEVYSLRNDSWTKFDDFPSLSTSCTPQCHRGELYWWSLNNKGLVFHSFYVGSEVFEKVDVLCPRSDNSYGTPTCLLNEESLVAVFPDCCDIDDDGDSYEDDDFVARKRRSTSWEIWLLLKYWVSESWTKLYVVTSPPEMAIEYCAGISRNLKFFFATFHSNLMNEKERYYGDRSLITLEIKTGKFNNLKIQGSDLEVVTNYVPSRISLQNYFFVSPDKISNVSHG